MEWLFGVIVAAMVVALIVLAIKHKGKPVQEKSAQSTDDSASHQLYTKYYLPLVDRLNREDNRQALAVLAEVLAQAKQEVCDNMMVMRRLLQRFFSDELTVSHFRDAPEQKQIECVLALGFSDIKKSALYCVSRSEAIPCADALTLLMIAEAEPNQRIQTVDAGDGADPGVLQRVVVQLSPCKPDWSCKVVAYRANGADGGPEGD